jgi:tRNA A-37 threonylcarbamoyl transferase component Bud32
VRGEVVGSYRLGKKLGEGGMGMVYRAVHTVLGKAAAVKMMRPQLCADEESVARFFNEAVLTANIRHPGIVEIFDYGVHDASGSAFISMALLDGESLETRLDRERRLPLVDALRIARQITSALAAAHGAGVVHRDLKPDNVFLTSDPDLPGGERIQLLDFGIAKLLDPEEQAISLTQTGTMIGTPLYMSPEQCRGRTDVDGRTDLYSLGCMLYRMLSGRPPFSGTSPLEVAAAHLRDLPEPLHAKVSGVGRPVSNLVDELLAKKPADRPESAAVLHRELGRLLTTIDTVKGIPGGGEPGVAPGGEPEPEATAGDLGHAATVSTDSTPPPLRRWVAPALALAALGAVGALVASRALDGGGSSLAIELAAPDRCGGLDANACRAVAWTLARGDGGLLDPDAAAALLGDACERGDLDACIDSVAIDRRYLLPGRDPHRGDPTGSFRAYLIVDFADRSLRGEVERVWENLRARFPGEVSLTLIPSANDSEVSTAAARAACATHRQKNFNQFLFFQDLSGPYHWSEERLTTQTWNDIDKERLIADYKGVCAREVAFSQMTSRFIAARPGTLYMEGYEVPAPHDLELAAHWLDRHIASQGDRDARAAEHQRQIQSTVRFAIIAQGPARPVTLISVCDPARFRCDMMRSITGGQAMMSDARVNELIIAEDPKRDLPARTLCAADLHGLTGPVLELLGGVLFDRAVLSDAAIGELAAASGVELAAFARTRDGSCRDEIRGNRKRLVFAGAPLGVRLFVNGRPAPIVGTPSDALIREELEIAERIGYGRRIDAADYYDWLVRRPAQPAGVLK